MATWRKSPPALIDAFAAALPADPRVERRQMFGYPCAFVNGNMACGLHQDDVVLRLGEGGDAGLAGTPFEPMAGRPMRGYFTAPGRVVKDEKALAKWVLRAVEHTMTLPTKTKAKAKKAPSAKEKPTASPERNAAKKPSAKAKK